MRNVCWVISQYQEPWHIAAAGSHPHTARHVVARRAVGGARRMAAMIRSPGLGDARLVKPSTSGQGEGERGIQAGGGSGKAAGLRTDPERGERGQAREEGGGVWGKEPQLTLDGFMCDVGHFLERRLVVMAVPATNWQNAPARRSGCNGGAESMRRESGVNANTTPGTERR